MEQMSNSVTTLTCELRIVSAAPLLLNGNSCMTKRWAAFLRWNSPSICLHFILSLRPFCPPQLNNDSWRERRKGLRQQMYKITSNSPPYVPVSCSLRSLGIHSPTRASLYLDECACFIFWWCNLFKAWDILLKTDTEHSEITFDQKYVHIFT